MIDALHKSPNAVRVWLHYTSPGCWQAFSPTRKETSYSDQTLNLQVTQKKKNSEVCPFNQVSAAVMTSASDEKWRPFTCFFSRVGLRTYQHPCTYLQIRSENRPLCSTNCIRKDLKIILYILGQIIARSNVTLQHTIKYMTVCWRVTHMVYFSSADGNRVL